MVVVGNNNEEIIEAGSESDCESTHEFNNYLGIHNNKLNKKYGSTYSLKRVFFIKSF